MLNSSRVERFGSIWKELETVEVPKEKFESLFAMKTVEAKIEVSKNICFTAQNLHIFLVHRALI